MSASQFGHAASIRDMSYFQREARHCERSRMDCEGCTQFASKLMPRRYQHSPLCVPSHASEENWHCMFCLAKPKWRAEGEDANIFDRHAQYLREHQAISSRARPISKFPA